MILKAIGKYNYVVIVALNEVDKTLMAIGGVTYDSRVKFKNLSENEDYSQRLSVVSPIKLQLSR